MVVYHRKRSVVGGGLIAGGGHRSVPCGGLGGHWRHLGALVVGVVTGSERPLVGVGRTSSQNWRWFRLLLIIDLR